MKAARILIAAIFGLACRADRPPAERAAESAASAAPTITGEGVGPVRLGLSWDSLPAVARVVRDTTETDNEGHPQEVAYVALGRDTVIAEMNARRVWRVAVTSAGIATADGIRVGTPLGRLVTSDSVVGATGEGKVFVLDRRRCGLSFGLSPEASPTSAELDSAKLLRLPGSTHVDEILVFACGRADAR